MARTLLLADSTAAQTVPNATVASESQSEVAQTPESATTLEKSDWLNQEPLTPTNTEIFESTTPSVAQADKDEEESGPRKVGPRLNGDFTSGPGAGYDSSYGSFSTFLPLIQNPGNSIGYFEGKWNVETDGANFGGNMLFGYRKYLESKDLVFGGYLGYDITDTGEHSFNQFGIGAEAVGDRWQVRANGYLPFGDTSQQFGVTSLHSARSCSPGTTGSPLCYSRTRYFQDALTGFDLEGGYRLFSWNTGNLSIYAGPYFYSGENTDSFIGGRGRLEAELTDNFKVGAGVQSDEEFGTNVILSLGASFGGPGVRHRDETEEEGVLSRLGSSVTAHRQNTVSVNETPVTDTRQAVITTSNGSQVTPSLVFVGSGGNSTGAYNDPYGAIGTGLNAVSKSGNGVVVVLGGTYSENVVVPDNVQLLSSATSLTTQDGTLSLASFGGSRPTIVGVVPTGTAGTQNPNPSSGVVNVVTLGSNTTFGGFTVTVPSTALLPTNLPIPITFPARGITSPPAPSGNIINLVAGRGGSISNVTVQDNILDGNKIATRGVFFGQTDQSGVFNVLRNSITNVTLQGIRFSTFQTSPKPFRANIVGNLVTNSGINFNAGTNRPNTLPINNNDQSPSQGIGAVPSGPNTIGTFYIANNVILNVGDFGIVAGAFGTGNPSTVPNSIGSTNTFIIDSNFVQGVYPGSSGKDTFFNNPRGGTTPNPFREGITTQARGGTGTFIVTNNYIDIGDVSAGYDPERVVDFRLRSRNDADFLPPFANFRNQPGKSCLVLRNNTAASTGFLLNVVNNGFPGSLLRVEPITGNTSQFQLRSGTYGTSVPVGARAGVLSPDPNFDTLRYPLFDATSGRAIGEISIGDGNVAGFSSTQFTNQPPLQNVAAGTCGF
jgi:hypothetical protein